jgi:hypothetical protein
VDWRPTFSAARCWSWSNQPRLDDGSGTAFWSAPNTHIAIIAEFPQLGPHDILKKWLYIDSRHDDFELTMGRVAKVIAQDDPSLILIRRRRERHQEGRRNEAVHAETAT